MAFGMTNATITQYYTIGEYDQYGSPVLSSPVSATHRVWIEASKNQQRAVGGDSISRTMSVVGDVLSTLNEGDVIQILPDQVGNESVQEAEQWRVETLNSFNSFVHQNSRIRRMELTVTKHVGGS